MSERTEPQPSTSGSLDSELREAIIPHSVGGRMGQVAPGTKLAVRELTDEELGCQVKRLMDLDDKPWENGVHPLRWIVCWANDPTKVLYDWFSPVGSYTKELAVKEADRYCRARGAVLVELPE